VADPVAFFGIEKQHLVGFSNRLISAEMPYIHAAIRKHQLRGSGALFRTLVPATAPAISLPDRDRLRFQQGVDGEFGNATAFIFRHRAHGV